MIPAEGYRLYLISVNTVPDGGEIKYMRAGTWLMFLMHNDDREPPWNESLWKTAPRGGPVEVGQITRFAARWGDAVQLAGTIDSAQNDGKTLEVDKRTGFRWE